MEGREARWWSPKTVLEGERVEAQRDDPFPQAGTGVGRPAAARTSRDPGARMEACRAQVGPVSRTDNEQLDRGKEPCSSSVTCGMWGQ